MKKRDLLGNCTHGVSFHKPCYKCEIISLKYTIEIFEPIVDSAIEELDKLKKKYPKEFESER